MSLRSRIAFVLPLLLSAAPAHATWTAGGNVVCNANLVQSNPTVVGDATGGAYVVWRDNRPSTQADVYVQHLDTNGNVVAGWPANGLAIESLSSTNNFPTSVTDGAGGVIAVWQDARGGLYAQRVNSAGTPQWTANGVRVAIAAVATFSNFEVIPDGTGGVIVTWEDTKNPISHDIYVDRVGAAGDTLWAPNGVLVCNATGNQLLPILASDGSGGAIIAWVDGRLGASSNRLYAQRVNSAGVPQWTANGVLAGGGQGGTDNVFTDQDLGACVDGAGGAFIIWTENRNAQYGIFLQHLTGAGAPAPGWSAEGAAQNFGSYDTEPKIVSDGAGGCVMAGSIFGITACRVSHVNGAGAGAWAQDFAMAAGSDGPALTRDGTGGGYVAYLSHFGTEVDAGRVTGLGTVPFPWHNTGFILRPSTGGGNSQVSIAATSNGDAIAAWGDGRNPGTTSTDIYATKLGGLNPARVDDGPSLPGLAIAAHPNPVHGALSARFTLAGEGSATLTVIDLAGRTRFTRDVSEFGAGAHTVALDGTRTLEPGVYFLALQRDSNRQSIRFVVVR